MQHSALWSALAASENGRASLAKCFLEQSENVVLEFDLDNQKITRKGMRIGRDLIEA